MDAARIPFVFICSRKPIEGEYKEKEEKVRANFIKENGKDKEKDWEEE